ncbi:MAG: AAA family ATPase [Methanospirillaceae archaeon]|nr:AAA family ATPase [Methanospirillaceae archaeon]
MALNSVTLVVIAASHTDSGKGIARLDQNTMRTLNLVNGDCIDIRGHKNIPAIVWNTENNARKKTEIAIDEETRSNAGCGIGDRVIIRKTRIFEAEKITFQPVTDIHLNHPEPYISKKVRGRPVISGQTIQIDLLGTTIPFIVTRVDPHGVGIVSSKTKIDVILEPQPPVVLPDDHHTIHYEDIGGLSREISLIREIVEIPLTYPDVFTRIGIDPPKGVLLYGPPGTGKTLLARAVAGEVDAFFCTLSGPEVMSRYYGDSEKRIRDIFEEAEKKAPSIIFIDEIDSIAPKRLETFGEVERRVTAQLLTMMDGLSKRGQVVVIAATNIPDAIDPALRRGGRFDREIEIGIPDKGGRLEIYRVHSKKMPLSEDVILEDWAETSYGFVGADIALHCKEAAMHAIRGQITASAGMTGIADTRIQDLMIHAADFAAARRIVEPSGMRELTVEIPDISWEQVAGLSRVKQEIVKIIEWPLQMPDLYSALHLSPPKGLLLYGPPGVGKTLLVKAIANRTQKNFISIKGPELLSRLVGESEQKVREAFRKARQAAPSIIFFDEIDSLVHRRGSDLLSRVTESVLSQILTEIDGIEELSDVMVIAATNRPDILDPAILRAGRIEKHIYIPPPGGKERREILTLYLSDIQEFISPDVSIPEIAELMRFYVGADIEAFVRELKVAGLSDYIKQEGESEISPPHLPVLIYPHHVKKVLEAGKGTLDDHSLELLEQKGWGLLYPQAIQDILNHAVSVINIAEELGRERHDPDLREILGTLRESVFWGRDDIPAIEAMANRVLLLCNRYTGDS